MEQLTTKDIEILTEALNVWEKQPTSDILMPALLTAMLLRGEDGAVEKKQEEMMNDAKRKTEERAEQKILLQAKLIGIRNEVLIHQATNI